MVLVFSTFVAASSTLFTWHFVVTDEFSFCLNLNFDQIISKTFSGGRPTAAFSFVSTIGRSIRTGCLIINSIKSSPDRDGLSRLCSV